MDFEVPGEIQQILDSLDAFIEAEIKPLEAEHPQFFDHRREYVRTNWDADGTPNQPWADGNDAVFGGGTGGAAGTVTVSGTVSPNTLTFDQPNSGGNYTIGGGTIDVAYGGGITVNATGTTTIASKVTSTTTENYVSMSVNTVNAGSALTLSGGTSGDPIGWNYGLQYLGAGMLALSGTSQFGKSGVRNGPGISVPHDTGGKLVISGDVTLADLATFGLGRSNTMDITGSLSTTSGMSPKIPIVGRR